MSGFGQTPTTTTETALATNQVFISSVAVPDTTNGDLTALEGGPISTDSNQNKTAPASMYIKDGNDITQGSSTDANTVASIMGRLTKIRDLLTATLTVSATSLPLPTGAALEAGHLASIDTHTPALGQALAAASVPVVLTAIQQTALTPPAAITGFAQEAGNLATIDTSTAASKTDLDTIVTNTNKIPASPAQEAGNLATVATNTSNASTVLGATTDVAVVGDNNGSVSAKLRGLTKIFNDIWDSVNHRFKVDGSGVTQPVSGTVTANQGGTWTVQPGNTANTTAWKVDGSAVTQPVSGTVSTAVGSALAPYGSNPAQTAASGADTLYKFGASGTTAFNHVSGQNNTPANVYLAFDQSTTVSGNQVYVVAPGQSFAFDRSGTVLHFSSPAQQSFGGQSGITVEAFA